MMPVAAGGVSEKRLCSQLVCMAKNPPFIASGGGCGQATAGISVKIPLLPFESA